MLQRTGNVFFHWRKKIISNRIGLFLLVWFTYLTSHYITPKITLIVVASIVLSSIHFFLGLTSELVIDSEKIVSKKIFSSETKTLLLSDVSHFMFYNKSVEQRNGHPNMLEAFMKKQPREEQIRRRIRLNFSPYEIDEILSFLYRQGFKVLLFEELKNIEETERYIEE
jgi:hypothetical protein